MKRAISLLLSLSMVFTMAAPVFAEGSVSAVIEPPIIAQETTSVPEESTSVPEESTSVPEESTSVPEESTSVPEESTSAAEESTSAAEESTSAAEESTSAAEESTSAAEESTSVPEDELTVSEETINTLAVAPVDAPAIPGYTQVTSTNLNANKYYLIVGVDSQGTAYALYADPSQKTVGAGASILDGYVTPGAFAAKLNIAENSVTANREITANPAIEVNDLRFTIEKNAGGVAFKSTNGLYLNVLRAGMLGDNPTSFSLTTTPNNSFVIKNSENRILDFNKLGDPNQFVAKPGMQTNTNFWGPGGTTKTSLPIYLYTQNDQPVNPDAPNVTLGENMSEMFNKQDSNNTWMFDGGIVTQGSVHNLKGARSYVYQFEEYIRWTQASVRDEWVTRHRFVFNVGKDGQTLADSLAKFDDRAAELDPRAAAYLIGIEDCKAGADGIETFKQNLKSYIDKSLALRKNTGFAVIQTPYPTVVNGDLYAAAAREVVKSLDQNVIGRVQLVDHFASNWDASYVNANGTLTDRGHFELGKQLSKAVFGSSDKYPADSVPANFPQLTYASTPAQYSKDAAAVTAGANNLSVTLPNGISGASYEVKTDSYTLTGTASGNNFTIADLPAGAAYTLTLTTTDGQTRLPVMVGNVKNGEAATQHSFTLNEELAKRMESGEPITWMFMGDSITHGAYHTCGYDSISQLFEKFLRDDLGRTNDLVLNTAVSSAATADTVQYLNERLNKYNPDVVFLMLGANCVGEGNAYQSNLRQIVDAAQAKGATVILRTPVCTMGDANKGGISFADQAEMMRQVAKEKGTLLIDQNPVWGNQLKQHPYLAKKLFNNDLHPNAIGHVWMFRMLLEGTGLAQDSSYLYNLTYDLGTTQTNNDQVKAFVKVEGNTATLDTAALAGSTALNFSDVTLTATEEATGIRYSVTVEGGKPAVLKDLPTGKTFAFTVSAQQKNANNIVNFAGTTDPQDVVDPLAIPGYTRVTSAELDPGKYYLVVGKDSSNGLFALYPDEKGITASAGNAISTSAAPAGAFAAELTIKGDKVTAARLEGKKPVAMNDLRFTVEKKGSTFAFAGSNDNYISIDETLLSKTPNGLSVSMKPDGAVEIKNDSNGRLLDFNKHGDPHEFKNNGATFNTNFWAPYGSTTFSIYLYAQNDTIVPPTVSKGELKSAISRADGMMTSDIYSAESKAALKAALDAAKKETDSTTSTVESVAKATQDLVRAMQAMAPTADKIAPGAPENGKTEGQPFPKGTGTSQTFRIPAITTLKDGSLAAAIDARWDACPDGYGIDTLFSISKDNGKTWEYTFPNFFNDSVNIYHKQAAAFIDPVMVQGKDGTIYLMTDVFPGGRYIGSVERVTGYEEIDGVQRLVLYPTRDGHTHNNYAYYVGDFKTAKGESKAFAPVIAKGDKSMAPAYYVDDHYYLYTADKAPMYCPQLGSDQYVQQNVFFYNADLHVRNATYLWLITSKDNGETWSAPTILNPQVRPSHDGTTHRFYGVGPGAGLALEDGTVMLPCYTNTPEKSSFIYTRDNGKTWQRSDDATIGNDWSSENALVQIDATTVRQFCRDGHGVLRYTDHIWNGTRWVRDGEPVRLENVVKTSANQISAIRYSKLINGKPVIMVSTAATGTKERQNGKIYAFNLNEDKTMTLLSFYEVTKPGVTYGYSSLTEQKDGSIGLLYEETFENGKYINIHLNKIIPTAVVDGKRTVEVPLFGTYDDPFTPVPTAEELKALDSSIVTAEIKDGKVIFTGVKEGTTSFTSNGVTHTVNVVPVYPTEQVKISCHGEHKITVNAAPSIVNNSDVITTTLEPITVTGGQGTTGTDKFYKGEHEALALSLYTFHQNADGFEVSALAADGTMTWLDAAGANGFPVSSNATTTKFIANNDNTFFVQSLGGKYLYFWRDGKNSFDATTDAGGRFTAGCKFMLYRLANEGETSSTELPGYVQATEIKDGGQYLIVAKALGSYYVMRPATRGDKFAHVLKADPKAEQITATVSNILTFKAQKAGFANIMVNGTVYQVSAEHQLTRVDRVEPTLSTPGNVLHWKCEIDGELFLDEAGTQPVSAKDVVIPAGTPLTPITPSKPVPSDTPLTPLTPASPVPTENPSQPDNNNSNNTTSSTPAPTTVPTGRVPTGDNANLGLWIAVIVLAGAGIVGITYLRKHKGDK